MTLRLVALAASVAAAAVCGLTSAVVVGRVVDEVNLHLPDNARFSPYGWHAPKYLRLLREYRHLFPSGPRIRQLRLLSIIGVLSAACGAVTLGLGVVFAGWLGAGGCAVAWLMHRNWRAR